jgi:DNA sulfur modification protein DndD
MIFKSITIHNLFSYYGKTVFELSPVADDKRNIVIIMGRNGYGKTSFLNSVKLLFGGVTKDLTAGVQRGSVSTQRSYVLGHQDWWGILNHKARSKGETHCGVHAILLDEAGQEITISRTWSLNSGDYKDKLEVIAPRKRPMEQEDAQQYLSRVLPLDYIPFFFFDAEELGYLAESNNNQTIEKMEQLLNIRPADNLRDCLKEIRREWNSEKLDAATQEQLLKEEHRLEELEQRIQNREWEREQALGEAKELEDERRLLQQKIRLLRGTGTLENASRLNAEKKKEEDRLAESLYALSASFERDAFLRMNAGLARKAMKAAEICASSQINATSELLLSLKDPIKQVFTTPPYPANRLSEDQIRFYQARLLRLLDSRDIAIDNENLFDIDTGRAKKLAQLLAAYQPEQNPIGKLSEELTRALNAEKASVAADKELQNLNQLSQDNKIRMEQLQYDFEKVENELLNKRDKIRNIESELTINRRETGPLSQSINNLQGKVKQSEAYKARLTLLSNMLNLLEAYKQKLKLEMREALETAFNRHLKQLLDSNALIHAVKIDEDFQIGYRDRSGAEVPMASLSAGMKQLAATALLWALKDASGRFLPVIIDTPLGRIDRAHQDNLLTHYYPYASLQVILLPTDSELDERKRALLAQYIYREYRLENPSGEETHIRRIEHAPELSHG